MLELIPTITTSFATAMVTNSIKGAEGPARALDDIMTLVGFGKLNEYAEKKRLVHQENLRKFKESIAKEIKKIPQEDLQDPPLSIVGPALEASKFFFEEEDLRKMFAKLITSAMNKKKKEFVHPSFIQVIKQLSPSDALFLQEFTHDARLPLGTIKLVENNSKNEDEKFKALIKLSQEEWIDKFGNKEKTIIQYFYISQNRSDAIENELSISSLSRLGIIETKHDISLSKKSSYHELETEFASYQSSELFNKNIPENFHSTLIKGIIDLTPFGASFLTTCS